MKDESDLTYMATVYMALADKTRLRLLSMMRDQEICVGNLTGALGESQPKISRHLAYLRNAGIVDARRDGKWMHYSIHWPDDAGCRGLLSAALEWISGDCGEARSTRKSRPPERSEARLAKEPSEFEHSAYAQANMLPDTIDADKYEAAHNELDDFLL
jgi:DNA-binding transcriptional ArsR family regulator